MRGTLISLNDDDNSQINSRFVFGAFSQVQKLMATKSELLFSNVANAVIDPENIKLWKQHNANVDVVTGFIIRNYDLLFAEKVHNFKLFPLCV